MERLTREFSSRVCLAERCSRLIPSDRSTCRWHSLIAAPQHEDPVAACTDDVVDWWELATPRRDKLEELRTSAHDLVVAQRANAELTWINERMVFQLLDRVVSAWQEETESPRWRLPPDGWILARILADYPAIRVKPDQLAPRIEGCEDAHRFSPCVDRVARLNQEHRHPTRPPFRPITERRRTDDDAVQLLAEQDRRNATRRDQHGERLRSAKVDSQHSALDALFKDPLVETTISSPLVVFHQIGDPLGASMAVPSEKDQWSFARHMALNPGEVVRYDHARATTLHGAWLGNHGKLMKLPEGLNSEETETRVRLELLPRRGLYVGEGLCGLAEAPHLTAELELVLPAGTFWEVVSIADAEHDMGRKREDYMRLRTIQMIEIGEEDVRGRPVTRMTASPDELDALAQLDL
ncbi:hypothetical protein [Brachybacterium kimchii]|uniref:Uncharacterized protein n=1 Tax=Brachybacterium kimchii TaxID=2942909 RepID=A0ABY4NB51_9MICO|nr:hypothetical protein [Brachybacterium kimchii]UQN31784.1 hypothetical protein M4486_19535 [Brachybacterium kimchii]